MAESVQIKSVSHRHEAIADWLLSNPERSKGECAKHIGVSQSWLSIVINSDCFREYFSERRKTYEAELREKLSTRQLEVSLEAYDRISDEVNSPESKPEFALAVVTHTANVFAGYAPKRRVTEEITRELSQPVDRETLATARATMTRKQTVTIEHESPAA